MSPSLFSSLRNFWGVLLAIFYTRLDLVTAELEDEASRAVRLLVVGLAALLFIGMAIFFLFCFLIVLAGTHKLVVLGIICGLCFLTGAGLLLAAKQMVLNRPKFLSQTLIELRRDVEALRTKMKSRETV